MKTRKSVIVLVIVAALMLVILCLNQYLRTRVYYNEPTFNGNVDGNIYNKGLFCEYGGMVYFSNPNDHGALYSMNTSGGDLKKITDDCAQYINVDDHYIYYCRNNTSTDGLWGLMARNRYGLIRINKNGKGLKNLDSSPCMGASLIGNTIYYFHYDKETATRLYQIGIDGSDCKCVFDSPIWAAASEGSDFYYSGVSEDHDIHRYHTEDGSSTTVASGNYYMPIVDSGYLYYLNLEKGYTLWRKNLSSNETEAIVGYRIDTYNVKGDKIYYQTADVSRNGLYCFDLITGENTRIADGIYCDLNFAGNYLYYYEFEKPETCYYVDVNNNIVGTL